MEQIKEMLHLTLTLAIVALLCFGRTMTKHTNEYLNNIHKELIELNKRFDSVYSLRSLDDK